MTTKEKTLTSSGKKARKKKDTVFKISYQSIVFVLGLFLIIAIVFISLDRLSNKQGPIPYDDVSTPKSEITEYGDIVTINYIIQFVNETVFDTSYENVAVEAGIYTSDRNYTALSFIVGNQSLIKGVDSAVIGLKAGQVKTVNLPPEEAYGAYDETQIQAMQRVYNLSKIDIIPINDFQQTILSSPEVGKTYESMNVPWALRVIEVDSESVTLEYLPAEGSIISTMLGNATVISVSNSTITLRENPVKGLGILTRVGFAKVLEFDDDSIFLDFNHPLAGKTLVFTVRVEDIVKGP